MTTMVELAAGNAAVATKDGSLCVSGLAKRIGGRTLFEDLSFSVGRGEMVAVTGPSGCGKSTLLNCCGLLTPVDAGTVEIDGVRATSGGRAARRALFRESIGFLFQNYALIEGATVRENVAMGAKYAGLGRAVVAERVADALERVGLGQAAEQRVYELSGGEQQRVALARLITKRPRLVLADEPTGALDAANRERIMELMSELALEAAVLVVTHDPAVVAHADRELRVRDGALAAG